MKAHLLALGIIGLLVPFHLLAQGLSITNGTTLKVVGNATIKLNNASLKNDGNFVAGSGTVVFQGSTATGGQLTGSQITTFNHLVVNRPGQMVQLGTNAQVNGNLTFTAGMFDLNGRNLTLGQPNGTLINESETNRIIGTSGGEVVIAPNLNAPNQSNPGNIGVVLSSAANLGLTTIRRGHVPATLPGIGPSVQRYFSIQPANNSNLDATLRFSYFESELNGPAETNLSLYRGTGSNWQTGNAIGTGAQTRDASQNWVQKAGIGQFVDNWTLAEGAILTCRSHDSLALVSLYNATNGANWANPWNLAQPIDTWYGVTLNAQGCVQGIELDNNQLDGAIPSLDLPELQVLNLSKNNLSGTIPSLNFPELKQLYLNNNILSGNIPNFSLPKLEELLLYANKLNGPIPNFNLPQLKILLLFTNQLSGGVPNFNLPNLQHLDLSENPLGGGIPNFNLPNLQIIALCYNQLTGAIPNFGMPLLKTLNLFGNQLDNNIPNFNLPNLKELNLYDNRLSGAIPNFNLPLLETLHLASNQLSGPIPNFNFPQLRSLLLAYNQLSGNAPNFNLPQLVRLSLSDNRLDGLPTLTQLPSLGLTAEPSDSLTVYNNKLTFEHILPNLALFAQMNGRAKYAPQDSFYRDTIITTNAGQNLTIDLGIDAAVISNVYEWNKISGGTTTITGNNKRTFSNIQAADAGMYYVKVTNPNAPDLTLNSRKITIVIGCVATTTNFSRTVCPGDTVLFNGEVFDTPGTYSRTITATSGCDSTLVLTLSHLPLPNANAGADQRVCAGTPVNLSASGGQSYRWSNGGTTANIQITPLTSGSMTVTVTGDNGCSKTDSVNVFVNIVPDVNPTADQTVCNGQMTQAIPHTGTWPGTTFDGANNMPSIGLGASALNVTSIAPFTAVNNGTAPVIATITVTPKLTASGLTCTGKPDTFTITVNPSAKPNITGKLTICPGGNTILNATGGNGYLWSTGASIASLTVNAAGVYTVTATATGGCTATATAQVTAQPAPNPKIGPTGLFAVCQGDSITLSPGTFNQYLWSTGATSATIRVPSPNNLYTVTVTDINTCTATATASVTQLQKVVASIAIPDTLTCLATQITLDGSGSDSGIFYMHSWSTPDGQIVSGANTLNAVVDKPGQYRLTVTGPTTTCPNTATVTVVAQNQAPTAVALTPKDVSCKGQTDGQLTVGQVSGGLAPFQYALNGATFGTTKVFTQLLPGNYTLEVRGRNGCVLSQAFTIKEGLGLNPNLGTNRLVCPGIAAVLDAGSFAGYQWSNNQTTQVLNATTPGTYTVTVSDGKGCTGTATVSVQHHPAVTALATATDTLTCTKSSVTIRSNGSSSGTGIVNQWSTANGNLVSGATTGTATVDKGGSYQFIVRNSQSGCADTAQVTVVQTGKPISGLALEVTDIRCAADQNGQIVASVAGSGTQPFAYNLNGGTFQSNGRFTGLAQGAYTIVVRGADGCEALTTASIDAPDVLQVSIPAPKLLEEGSTVDLQPIVSGAQGALTYAWEGSNLSCNDCAEPNAAPVFNTGYALTVTDENGCTASATVLVAVNSNLGPDIITPGSPGKNDELFFPDLEADPAKTDNDIVIFNRWGQVVFKAAPYLNNWKGETENGVALPEGTYYYVLLLRDGKKNAIHGNVLLIR